MLAPTLYFPQDSNNAFYCKDWLPYVNIIKNKVLMDIIFEREGLVSYCPELVVIDEVFKTMSFDRNKPDFINTRNSFCDHITGIVKRYLSDKKHFFKLKFKAADRFVYISDMTTTSFDIEDKVCIYNNVRGAKDNANFLLDEYDRAYLPIPELEIVLLFVLEPYSREEVIGAEPFVFNKEEVEKNISNVVFGLNPNPIFNVSKKYINAVT